MSKEDIVKMSGLELGTPVIELDKDRIKRRIMLIPRIASVNVEQRGPNEVVLHVREKDPVARVYFQGEAFWVARDGAIIGKVDSAGSDSKIPWLLGVDVLPSGGGIAGFKLDLRVVKRLDMWLPILKKSPMKDFTSIAFPEPGTVVVMWHEIEFFLGDASMFKKHVRYMNDLLTLQVKRNQRYQYIDLRFHDIVARFLPVD